MPFIRADGTPSWVSYRALGKAVSQKGLVCAERTLLELGGKSLTVLGR